MVHDGGLWLGTSREHQLLEVRHDIQNDLLPSDGGVSQLVLQIGPFHQSLACLAKQILDLAHPGLIRPPGS